MMTKKLDSVEESLAHLMGERSGNAPCGLSTSPAKIGSAEGSVPGQQAGRCLSTAVTLGETAWDDRWSLLKG